MIPTARRLYDLLPAVYRLRGATQGSLQAVLSVLAEQLEALEDDLDQLYDDLFIETCAEWVVPYIGDLIGVRPVYGVTAQTVSQRAQVANTIRYRRRKGTIQVLENLARDVTGWPTRAVESFLLLATTQYLNHLRPGNLSFTSLRNVAALELIGTPFDSTAHTADVRRIAHLRGKYNIPNIGLFLWRLQPFTVSGSQPFEVSAAGPARYTFNPLGLDEPLYNPAREEPEYSHLSDEVDVPGPLRRRPLWAELSARRAALATGRTYDTLYFGSSPAFEIEMQQPDGSFTPVDPANIFICDLSTWPQPSVAGQVLVDPLLGRFTLKDPPTFAIRASYTYAFSAAMGGGPYDRQVRVGEWLPLSQPNVTFQRGVTQDQAVLQQAPLDPLVTTLGQAVTDWHSYLSTTSDAAPFGIIAIMDSATYAENLTIEVPKDARLAIVAADLPSRQVDDGGLLHAKRLAGDISPVGVRPVVAGAIAVTGTSAAGAAAGGPSNEFILDGLLVTGSVGVRDGDLGRLRISDCTLVPGGGLLVEGGPGGGAHNRFLVVHVENSILGPLQLEQAVPTLEIYGSIVVSAGTGDPTQVAISASGADATVDSTTVLGTTDVRSLSAQNSIFSGIVTAKRGQVGCVRYCYLPPGSCTPRPYRCQPDRAVAEALKADPALSTGIQDAIAAEARGRVVPQFNSLRYGDAAYAQLALACAVEIRSGAEDDSELGAFHDLFQPQREINLRVRLDEYLRFGMEAGIFYVT